jgi:hypothetical protein
MKPYRTPLPTATGERVHQPGDLQTGFLGLCDETGFLDATHAIPTGSTRGVDIGSSIVGVGHTWREGTSQ